MPITYRTTGAWGAGKGGNLTPAEVDLNFYDLVQQLAALDLGPTPAEIDTITLVGNQLTFILDDARELGPYTIPRAALRWRGDWAASTTYLENDQVIVPGLGIFLILLDHTSPAVFDEAHQVGGEDAYQLVYSEPRSIVVSVSGTTLTPSVIWGYHRCSNAAGCAVTIPSNTTDPVPVGSEFHFRQGGAAAVTFAGEVGVDLNIPAGRVASTGGVGSVVTVKKVATNEWDVFGLLEAA